MKIRTKIFICVILVCTLFMTSCGIFGGKTIDLMKNAISVSDYKDGIENLSDRIIGTDHFEDYSTLHSSPLKSADYVCDIRVLGGSISSQQNGVSDFFASVVNQYGFKYDTSIDYPVYQDLEQAFTTLFQAVGDTSYLNIALEKCNILTDDSANAIGDWICACAYAYTLISDDLEKISQQDMEILENVAYCNPHWDDIKAIEKMKSIYDNISLENFLKSGIVMSYATEKLSQLSGETQMTLDGQQLTIPTPIGDIILGSQACDTYQSPNALLILDPCGNDIYNGKIAASSKSNPISVVVDLSGDDVYLAQKSDGASQGTGIVGTGILVDKSGTDKYTADHMAQGCCILGTGILLDADGNDNYDVNLTGQGAGFFGFALLSDTNGNDNYDAKGYAQSCGGPRCMAFLIDTDGDDNYYVKPKSEGEYSFMEYEHGDFSGFSGNWSQGCGWGQRVIGLSGGIAGLIDLCGNDNYTGAVWVQGVGYWNGIGFLFDENGNDNYNSFYYSQASVAHSGIGIVTDIAGDDVHNAKMPDSFGGNGASIGFTWDRGVTMFIDDGGNDTYIAGQTAYGVAWSAYDDKGSDKQDMTYSMFIDTDGDDKYSITNISISLGWGLGGYFIDCGGTDSYPGYSSKDNTILPASYKYGGIFTDYSVNKDTPAKPTVDFWEKAKDKIYRR